MSKKILISLSIIAAVAAIVVGATTAFFSDTETSTGNTFTAGAIDLKIDNTCHYDGMICEDGVWKEESEGSSSYPELIGEDCACTWLAKDLDGDVFVNFQDLKPGDHGEDTISFHVNSNDSWLCGKMIVSANLDVTCTEPESESSDLECSQNPSNPGKGELGGRIGVFAWVDMCDDQGKNASPGDNIYQPGCDVKITQSPIGITGLVSLDYKTIADSNSNIFANGASNTPLEGGEDYYIGAAWCFGNMSVDETTGEISCDGSSIGNEAQTDILQFKLYFEAVQSRNNDSFVCGSGG